MSLPTPEYQNSPNFLAFLKLFLQKLDDITAFVDSIDEAFDIDYAVGVQLDTIGQIVGVSRYLNFQPSYGMSPILGDEDYRVLLKAQIGQNQWDGTQDGLNPLWAALFPGSVIAIHDNHYMDMDVFIDFPNASSIFIDLIQNGFIVPKPAGVKQRIYIGPPFPLFGFDYDDPYVNGFDKGNWWSGNVTYPKFGLDTDNNLLSGFDKGNWAQS